MVLFPLILKTRWSLKLIEIKIMIDFKVDLDAIKEAKKNKHDML